jgi:hypothetical protein
MVRNYLRRDGFNIANCARTTLCLANNGLKTTWKKAVLAIFCVHTHKTQTPNNTHTLYEVRHYDSAPSSYIFLLAYFPYFEKIKVGLWNLHPVCVSHPINYWMPEPIFMKCGMYIIALELRSTACFLNPSNLSMCLYMYPIIVARQRQRIHVQRTKCYRRCFLCGPRRMKGK